VSKKEKKPQGNFRTQIKVDRADVNPLTSPLTSRRCILNIYSTNIRTEYFNT
jgi:hypothetical protein